MQITFKSGAQIVVDVEEFETTRNQYTNELTGMTWTTPARPKAKLHTLQLSEVAAIVALR